MMIHAGTKTVDIVTIDSYWKEHFKGIGSFKYLHKNYNKQIAKNNYLKISSIPVSQTNKIDTIVNVEPEKKEETKKEVKQETKQEHEVAPTQETPTIKLEDTKLDSTGKKFFNEWNITIEGDATTALKK
jgi:NADH:ubiquinone oxidoreductase subunit